MKKSFLILLMIAGSLYSSLIAQKEYNHPFKFQFKKVADDIYLAYRPDPLKVLVEGNSTIIINDRDVIVFDATGSPTGARQIVNKIKELTDKPVRYLINSHGHGDHTLGNEEFIKAFPMCEIISRRETRKYMQAPKGSKGKNRGIAYVYEYSEKEEFEKRVKYITGEIERVTKEAKPGYEKVVDNLTEYLEKDLELRRQEYSKLTVTPPTLTLEKEISIFRGEREIQILYLGKGDTTSDIWLYLPNEKILCSPDAIVNPIPYGFSRHQIAWLETLKEVMNIEYDILIPGHGEIQYDKKYLSMLIDLLQSIQNQVKSGIERGMSLEEITDYVDVKEFEKKFTKGDPIPAYYFEGYSVQPVIERTYNQLVDK